MIIVVSQIITVCNHFTSIYKSSLVCCRESDLSVHGIFCRLAQWWKLLQRQLILARPLSGSTASVPQYHLFGIPCQQWRSVLFNNEILTMFYVQHFNLSGHIISSFRGTVDAMIFLFIDCSCSLFKISNVIERTME